ncbi:MAG: ABC transporter ATP-binding protein, partial [Flammeovirgaceae bacterium]|nr:ABC transporter ATP-binding protein [Flammeovirgaceae bacterium]
QKKIVSPSQQLIPGHPDIELVKQESGLAPHQTVRENILHHLRKCSDEYKELRMKILLKICLIEYYLDRYPNELSGGEQQRVALACALASEPELLLMDEPFSTLDIMMKLQLRNAIHQIVQNTKTTAIFVMHDTLDALSIATRIAVMREGKLVQIATPEQIYYQPISPYVARFFPNANIVTKKFLAQYLKEHLDVEAFQRSEHACIRAENIHICPEKNAHFHGDVTRVHFQGSYYQVVVSVEEGLSLLVNTQNESIRVGMRLPLRVDIERIHFFSLHTTVV